MCGCPCRCVCVHVSGVSLEAGCWHSTAAYVASHHQLLNLTFERVVVVISSTEKGRNMQLSLCTSYFNSQLYSCLLIIVHCTYGRLPEKLMKSLMCLCTVQGGCPCLGVSVGLSVSVQVCVCPVQKDDTQEKIAVRWYKVQLTLRENAVKAKKKEQQQQQMGRGHKRCAMQKFKKAPNIQQGLTFCTMEKKKKKKRTVTVTVTTTTKPANSFLYNIPFIVKRAFFSDKRFLSFSDLSNSSVTSFTSCSAFSTRVANRSLSSISV